MSVLPGPIAAAPIGVGGVEIRRGLALAAAAWVSSEPARNAVGCCVFTYAARLERSGDHSGDPDENDHKDDEDH